MRSAVRAPAPAPPPPTTKQRIPSLPTLSPSLFAEALAPALSPPRPAVFPLDRLDGAPAPDGKHAALWYLARNGIYHGLRALGLGAGHAVLMPSYHHGVEVEAVRRSGARVIFYRVDRRWNADLDDARRKLRESRGEVRALYLTHFAGWPQPIDEARALCREHDLALVEDCALSLLSRDAVGRPLGASGDLAVFCLYKALPLPHGGVALCASPFDHRAHPRPPPLLSTLHHLAGSLRAHAALASGPSPLWEAARSLGRATVDRAVEHERVGTQHLDASQLDLGASSLVPRLLGHLDGELIAVRRRRNHRLLAAALGDERTLQPRPLPPRAVPLFFPLLVADKQAALARLDALGIEAVDFWGAGDPDADAQRFPDAAWLRRHVIELPIHQDLDDEAVARVARAVKRVIGHG
jgi:dTDP-4-amino-4,6-dideoxygalactose transaminase